MNESAVQRLLQDIFRSYQRVQKNDHSKESIFGSMLTEVYKKIRQDKVGQKFYNKNPFFYQSGLGS